DYFFFQAEDGIRDPLVTGVQTCALPILGVPEGAGSVTPGNPARRPVGARSLARAARGAARRSARGQAVRPRRALRIRREGRGLEIGRASWRERGEVWEAGVRV